MTPNTMEEAPVKRDNVRRQVIAYLVLGAVLAVLLAGAIAARQGAFTRTAQLYFLADTAAGIAPGVGVRLSGFRIGSVSDVALLPDLKVKVTLEIEEQHFAALRSDASAEWFKEQLQAAIIELRPGSSASALSRSDPRVSHSRRKTLTEVANDLRARLAPVLDDVKQLTGTVAEHKGDIAAGFDADIALVDPTRTWTIQAKNSPSTQGYTPFEDLEMSASVTSTFLRGHLIYDKGEVLGKPRGQYLFRPTA